MISCESFYKSLAKAGIEFFSGVPDSLLKDICAYITTNCASDKHVITANEGNAVALATGYHLATGKVPLVYLQNSGLGNIVNPLTSLTNKKVYGIPMVLLIGWRGEPGVKDEPQHIFQGEITESMLEVLKIPYRVISGNSSNFDEDVRELVTISKSEGQPVAILIKKGTFSPYKYEGEDQKFELEREEAISHVMDVFPSDKAVFLSTTGKISRELYELRVSRGEDNCDFYNVGSMGHISQIGLGVAMNTDKTVVCLDGDGSVLMHMGSLPIIGSLKVKNLIHIVLNNASHDSVGGQPTIANEFSICDIAKASNYRSAEVASSSEDIKKILKNLSDQEGPHLLEVKVNKGARKDLGRPKSSPVDNKTRFMNKVKS